MQMDRRVLLERLLYLAVFASILSVSLYFAIDLGIEKKTWWQRGYYLLAGGGLGAAAGWVVFAFVGTVGFVAGPLFGAVGVISFVAAGILGGIGLGAVFDTAIAAMRNPSAYHINYGLIFLIMAAGLLAAFVASHYAVRLARRLQRIE